MQETTCVFLINKTEREVFLALAQSGICAGKWNGPGGKIEPGESRKQAAQRETKEEVGIVIFEEDLEQVAQIVFRTGEKRVMTHFFIAYEWDELHPEAKKKVVTGEMIDPKWHPFDLIPYHDMMPGDKEFLPRILAGEHLYGFIHHDDKLTRVEYSWFGRNHFGGEQ